MSMQEILKLSLAERILIMEKIWDSIEHDNLQISPAQKQELDKRLERFKKGETKFYSWEDIKKELHAAR